MTLDKSTHFQNDLRKLFTKYGITNGLSLFVHDEAVHITEANVSGKNTFVSTCVDSLSNAIQEMNPQAKVINFNSSQNN